jgi:dTDP-4-dehydrorhamnose reductase
VGWELERLLPQLGEVFAFGRDELDLANPDHIREKIRLLRPNIIVNAAAYNAVEEAEEEQELAMAVNGIAPGILAEEAKKLGALLVHYSTDYVFDGTRAAPYTEDDIPNPLNVYGKTKLAGEEAIRATWEKHLLFRTSWIYGMRGKNFLLTILKLAKEREEIRVVDDQFGAPTWCRMIAEKTYKILLDALNPQEGSSFADHGIYHLVSQGHCSWYEFALAITRQFPGGKPNLLVSPISTDEYPSPAKRPRNSLLSCKKVLKNFEIALPSWEEDLTFLSEATHRVQF